MGVDEEAEGVRRLLHQAVVRSVGRAVGMGVVEFTGPGGEELGLHIQCPFRFVHDDRVLLGSQDMKYPQKGAGPSAFDDFRTVYDERAQLLNGLLTKAGPRVESVDLGKAGDLTLSWGPGIRLEVFPDCSGREEAWRVLVRGGAHHGYPPGIV
ncbi:hypothetical protein ACFWOY_09135 [Streptomyces sp. NPDC058423]|uniref:hypothetical protein n=1 Tax=unclassified Streptomyces TaxID=2593676 RepID=UPI0036644035